MRQATNDFEKVCVTLYLDGLIVVPTAYAISLKNTVSAMIKRSKDPAIQVCNIVAPCLDGDDEISMRLELSARPETIHLIRRSPASTMISMALTGLVNTKRERFDMSRGHYKPEIRRISVAPGVSLRATCLANVVQLEMLLSKLTHVGALRTFGYGKIEAVEVKLVDRYLDTGRGNARESCTTVH